MSIVGFRNNNNNNNNNNIRKPTRDISNSGYAQFANAIATFVRIKQTNQNKISPISI
jgi:hypothetical protein